MQKVCGEKIENINMMLDNMLSEKEKAIVANHIKDCAACSNYYKNILAMKTSLSNLDLSLEPEFAAKITMSIRKKEKSSKRIKRIYYVSSFAAACMVVVFSFFAFGGFKGMLLSNDVVEGEKYGELALEEKAQFTAEGSKYLAADENLETTIKMPLLSNEAPVLGQGNLDDYRFETSALRGENSITVNPDGLPLDIEYEDYQDIFYASRLYSVSEIIDILKSVFGVNEIFVDDTSVRFDLNLEFVLKLEFRLDLIAAEKLKEDKEIVKIRIVSIKSD